MPTILVVDDNKELVALLTSLFEEAGYSVVGANKGRPAVELGKSEPVAVRFFFADLTDARDLLELLSVPEKELRWPDGGHLDERSALVTARAIDAAVAAIR